VVVVVPAMDLPAVHAAKVSSSRQEVKQQMGMTQQVSIVLELPPGRMLLESV
jgi:hypothetical protein